MQVLQEQITEGSNGLTLFRFVPDNILPGLMLLNRACLNPFGWEISSASAAGSAAQFHLNRISFLHCR